MSEDSSGPNSILRRPGLGSAFQNGLYAALVTSRRSGERCPNFDATVAIAEWVCGMGIDGVVLLGATGEFLDFEIHERGELVRRVAAAVNCPVLVNCSHPTLHGAVSLGKAACDHGASAVMIMPPPFYHYPPSDVRAFFQEFAERMDRRVPLILYNLPQFTDWIQYEIAEELLASGLYSAIKDSSGDQKYFDRLVSLKSLVSFRLFAGNDSLFAHAHRAGADGAISGCACAVPELMVALRAALLTGNSEAAETLEDSLRDFLKWLERFPVPEGIRQALAERCFGVGMPAVPMGEINEGRLRDFREWLAAWLPLLPGSARAPASIVTLGS